MGKLTCFPQDDQRDSQLDIQFIRNHVRAETGRQKCIAYVLLSLTSCTRASNVFDIRDAVALEAADEV